MKNLYFSLIFSLLTLNVFAQSVTIDPKNTATNIIDAKSTNQGMTVPKMTTAQKTAIAIKTEGMMVYDTDAHQFSYWTGSVWVNFGNATSAAGAGWSQTGNNITNSNTGNVGIGTGAVAPGNKLEINTGVEGFSGLRLKQITSFAQNDNFADAFADIPSVTGLAYSPSQNLFATDFTNNKIYQIDQFGTASVFVSGGLTNPHDIVYGPDGNLYVSNYGAGTISKITVAGVVSTFASGFSNPVGLTFDTAGNLFVVNNSTGQLSKVNAAGTSITLNFGTGLTSPYGCVFNSVDNSIYVANYGANEIAKFSSAGGVKTTFVNSGVSYCTGITKDNAGIDFYVAQATPETIVKITQAGLVSPFSNATYPFDLVFDGNNFLFIASQTINKVLQVRAIVNNVLSVNEQGDVIKQESIPGWQQVGNDVQNTNTELTRINSKPSLATNAVFGSNGQGISFQKNWPTIGYNVYRDKANVQRYMGTGFGMLTSVDQNFGKYFWNKAGSGTTNDPVGANEQFIASLSQSGQLDLTGNIVARKAGDFNGSAILAGSVYNSYFQYGNTEDTYIRGGKVNSSLILNDIPGGKVGVGGQVAPSSNLDVTGSVAKSFKFINSDYTLTDQDYTIIANMQTDPNKIINITLPSPGTCRGRIYSIRATGMPLSNTANPRYEAEDMWQYGAPCCGDKGYVAIKQSNGTFVTGLFKYSSYNDTSDPLGLVGGVTQQSEQRTNVTIQSVGTRWVVISDNYFFYRYYND
jgi:DNA-binding beta-propeller fold protein YncE